MKPGTWQRIWKAQKRCFKYVMVYICVTWQMNQSMFALLISFSMAFIINLFVG